MLITSGSAVPLTNLAKLAGRIMALGLVGWGLADLRATIDVADNPLLIAGAALLACGAVLSGLAFHRGPASAFGPARSVARSASLILLLALIAVFTLRLVMEPARGFYTGLELVVLATGIWGGCAGLAFLQPAHGRLATARNVAALAVTGFGALHLLFLAASLLALLSPDWFVWLYRVFALGLGLSCLAVTVIAGMQVRAASRR